MRNAEEAVREKQNISILFDARSRHWLDMSVICQAVD